jgi:hypothetical protein
MQWLNRNLIFSPICYCLCLSNEEFEKELKRLKLHPRNWPDFVNPGADATAHFFESTDTCDECAIICLDLKPNRLLCEVMGLLTHECVHIWQAIKNNMGEKNPSNEFEAYSIHWLSQQVINAFLKTDQGKALLRKELKRTK